MAIQKVLEAYGSDIIGSHVEVGTGGHEILNPSGTSMAQEEKMQFTGNVTVTDDSTNGKTVINIEDSGHTIKNSSGIAMTQQSNMQFADSFVTNDSIGEVTVVENIKEVLPADYDSTTDEGIIVCDDGEDAVIHPSSEDKVEVTADGNTTRRDLFNWLFNHCDTSKIRENAYIVYSGNGRIYHYEDINNGTYIFAWESIRATTIEKVCLQLNSSTSTEIDWTLATTGNTKEENYSYKPANGYKYTLYYGNKKAVVDLQTTANRCWYDSNTTVKQKLDTKADTSNIVSGSVSLPYVSVYYCQKDITIPTNAKVVANFLYGIGAYNKTSGIMVQNIDATTARITAFSSGGSYVTGDSVDINYIAVKS